MTKQVEGTATQATQAIRSEVREAKSRHERNIPLPMGMRPVEQTQDEIEEMLADKRMSEVEARELASGISEAIVAPPPSYDPDHARGMVVGTAPVPHKEPELVTPPQKTVLDVTFDKLRPYGTCHGVDETWSAHPKFYQDGLYFTNEGQVIPDKGQYTKKLAEENRPRKKVMMEVEVGDDGEPILPTKKTPAKTTTQDGPLTGIDVFAWARGESDPIPFGEIRREVRRLYGDDIRSAHEMRAYLLDGGFLKRKTG